MVLGTPDVLGQRSHKPVELLLVRSVRPERDLSAGTLEQHEIDETKDALSRHYDNEYQEERCQPCDGDPGVFIGGPEAGVKQ